MNTLIYLLGVALTLVVTVDILLTVMYAGGAGFLTSRLSRAVWSLLFAIAQRDGKRRLLNLSGFLTLLATLLMWIFGLWGSYLLIFMAQSDSVVKASNGRAADVWEKIYFTGFTLSSLGNGDFVPNSDLFRVTTALCALSGLVLITMAVTYLLSVLSAVNAKRSLALYLDRLGQRPANILNNAWDGAQLSNLSSFLEDIFPMTLAHSERHLAFPVIHFFHRNTSQYSISVGLARLDEALTIALCALPADALGNIMLIERTREAIGYYLQIVEDGFISDVGEVPPVPESADFPAAAKLDENCFGRYEKRRALLLQAVNYHGWQWEEDILRH